MPQTAEQIENAKAEKNREYLETPTQYYAEEIKKLKEIEDEEQKYLFTETIGATYGMVVNNKTTFVDWFIENEFGSNNVKILGESKAYIVNLIKRTIEDRKITIQKDYKDMTVMTTMKYLLNKQKI